MATRRDLDEWVLEALAALGGEGTIVDVCRWIWASKKHELEGSGDLLLHVAVRCSLGDQAAASSEEAVGRTRQPAGYLIYALSLLE